MTMKLPFFILILTLTGCATVELNEDGSRVKILTELPAAMSEDVYEELGDVSCNKGINARSSATNIIQCRNELRNNAAHLGADALVIQHQQLGSAGCANCIVMVGTAYRIVGE